MSGPISSPSFSGAVSVLRLSPSPPGSADVCPTPRPGKCGPVHGDRGVFALGVVLVAHAGPDAPGWRRAPPWGRARKKTRRAGPGQVAGESVAQGGEQAAPARATAGASSRRRRRGPGRGDQPARAGASAGHTSREWPVTLAQLVLGLGKFAAKLGEHGGLVLAHGLDVLVGQVGEHGRLGPPLLLGRPVGGGTIDARRAGCPLRRRGTLTAHRRGSGSGAWLGLVRVACSCAAREHPYTAVCIL
jgi:hypothetical protein